MSTWSILTQIYEHWPLKVNHAQGHTLEGRCMPGRRAGRCIVPFRRQSARLAKFQFKVKFLLLW